jgi:hypothetical protein
LQFSPRLVLLLLAICQRAAAAAAGLLIVITPATAAASGAVTNTVAIVQRQEVLDMGFEAANDALRGWGGHKGVCVGNCHEKVVYLGLYVSTLSQPCYEADITPVDLMQDGVKALVEEGIKCRGMFRRVWRKGLTAQHCEGGEGKRRSHELVDLKHTQVGAAKHAFILILLL